MLEKALRKLQQNKNLYQKEWREKGFAYVVMARFRKFLYDPLIYRYYLFNQANRSFTFNKKKYYYTYKPYNFTWTNERAVEVSLIWEIVKRNKNKDILEIGNVLAHYHSICHDVLDKYEISKGVINEDVVTYNSKKKYDYIVSVSTFEHVGWDEKPRDSKKIPASLLNLKRLLKKDGTIIFTVPFGYNSDLQKLIDNDSLPLTKKLFLKRISKDNRWKQASWDEVKRTKYNAPFQNANAILVGYIQR